MPRQKRLLLTNSFYHIIVRGNNHLTVFRTGNDYRYYLKLIDRFKKNLPFDLYHYCLMPNHIHFLVQVHNENNFSCFMKKINLAYFYHYKKFYSWVGHLWQDRFKSQAVGNDEYFIQCGKYIELNPVRAKIVKDPTNYQYSSYQHYVLGKKNPLITDDLFYQNLGKTAKERRIKYQDMVISDLVQESYLKKSWGSGQQRHNESEKMRYHLNSMD